MTNIVFDHEPVGVDHKVEQVARAICADRGDDPDAIILTGEPCRNGRRDTIIYTNQLFRAWWREIGAAQRIIAVVDGTHSITEAFTPRHLKEHRS